MATKRDFLKAASLLAGGVGIAGAIPESVKRAVAIEPAPGSTYKNRYLRMSFCSCYHHFVMAPHTGGGTRQAADRATTIMAEKLARCISPASPFGSPLYPVYRMSM